MEDMNAYFNSLFTNETATNEDIAVLLVGHTFCNLLGYRDKAFQGRLENAASALVSYTRRNAGEATMDYLHYMRLCINHPVETFGRRLENMTAAERERFYLSGDEPMVGAMLNSCLARLDSLPVAGKNAGLSAVGIEVSKWDD